MTNDEKAQLKEKLQNEKAKVEKRISSLKELTKSVEPDNAIGRVSRMDAINNKSVNDAALRTAENKLQSIENALQNIGEEDFGHCKRCGKPIQMGRLVIMPESTKCVKCAQI